MKLKSLKISLIVIFTVLLSMSAWADCVNTDGDPVVPCVGDPGEIPGQTCCADATVPFDGGVSFLIAAGLGVGGYGIFKRKKNKRIVY